MVIYYTDNTLQRNSNFIQQSLPLLCSRAYLQGLPLEWMEAGQVQNMKRTVIPFMDKDRLRAFLKAL